MINYFYFIILTVLLNASAQLLIKKGVSSIYGKDFTLKLFFEKIPRRIIESAVKNMLPNGLRQKFYNRLRVYSNSEHPHEAQNPIPFNWN